VAFGKCIIDTIRNEAVVDGQGAQVTFKVNSTSAVGEIYFNYSTYGQSNYRRWGLYMSGGKFYRRSYVGTTYETAELMSLKANTWYVAQIVLDGNNQFKVKVWERDTPSVWAENNVTHNDWAGLTWLFKDLQYSYTQDMEEYREMAWTNGTGQRTGMSDISGWTTWTYDQRGRTTRERKTITDSGTFVSQWGYNSSDMVVSMVYPGGNNGQAGESLLFAYNKQGALTNLYSTDNNVYYVQNVIYDAAGRVDYRTLGATSLASYALLKTDYICCAWTSQAGRLPAIESGQNGSTFTPIL
jgi:hypothetical protein